ncbi:hypothetical protein ACVWY1_003105 [Pseudomonas sp. TE6288]|uniref:hypothetical protein n=1 Tax=Pseudomonas hunanensis TaxID=1247546 RepID=UPI002405A2F8|nr:hypothetical protein [Pseudomonas hunanensis]MDF9753984.1 hypothetical protein [Pseudomonas hunanensis]
MIKFEYLPGADLRAKYDLHVVQSTQQKMREFIQSLPPEQQDKYAYFDDAKINEILSCQPEGIVDQIYEIYGRFPELADRYWPTYFLKDAPIPHNVDEYGARTRDEKNVLDALYVDAIAFLEAVTTPGLTYINSLLDLLRAAGGYARKRDALANIMKAAAGENLATEKFKEDFPEWINRFEGVFNYSALSSDIGHDITDEWKIFVCLYCNDEPIQTKGDQVKFRTDLDHFYPRTKFPFLAVTLSNLIPAGKTCNQSYKRNKDMIGSEHPFVRGVGQPRLFHLVTPVGEAITENNFSVTVLEQGGKLDANLSGFEIAHNYGISDEIKSWVADAFGAVEMIVGYNDPKVKDMLLKGLVKVEKPAYRERHKKFKTDSINQFAGKEIVSFL